MVVRHSRRTRWRQGCAPPTSKRDIMSEATVSNISELSERLKALKERL
jgi:hypothetical protein